MKALEIECNQIVAQHLPETLQSVWWEITLALTSARWNLVAAPSFQMNSRGSSSVVVGVDSRKGTPARYLFNQAEQHLMGLSWFFTRHLTHGRFRHAFVVMDDPAQEMDQTTFRSFCRFIQTFLRMQESQPTPYQLVVLLHQEDRALDLARATLGRFLALSWAKPMKGSESEIFREIRLTSEEFHPPKASFLFGEELTKQ